MVKIVNLVTAASVSCLLFLQTKQLFSSNDFVDTNNDREPLSIYPNDSFTVRVQNGRNTKVDALPAAPDAAIKYDYAAIEKTSPASQPQPQPQPNLRRLFDRTDALWKQMVQGTEGLSTTAAEEWATFQRQIVAANPVAKNVKLRTLLLVPVDDRPGTVALWTRNVAKLRQTVSGDDINFVFFHFSDAIDVWDELDWYKSSDVVGRIHKPHATKPEFWHELAVDLTDAYDYIWPMDGDFDLAYFSWAVYRLELLTMRPMVSEPYKLSLKKGDRIGVFGEKVDSLLSPRGDLYLAKEKKNRHLEQAGVIMESAVWRTEKVLIEHFKNRTADWGVEEPWDTIAGVAADYCSLTGPYLIMSSPIVHRNTKTLRKEGSKWKKSCVNCKMVKEDADVLVSALQALESRGCFVDRDAFDRNEKYQRAPKATRKVRLVSLWNQFTGLQSPWTT